MQYVLFPTEVDWAIRFQRFEKMELGQLKASLPIKELAKLLPEKKTKVGSKPWFDNEGKIALQFLKAYEDCSDARLLSNINTDWKLQLFCGLQLSENEEIKDPNLIWQIRKQVSQYLNIEEFQSILIKYWKGELEHKHLGLSDATCYESYIKYPTDVGLLWDCASWLNEAIRYYSKELGLRLPRNKFKDQSIKQLAYARKRRKTKKLQKRRRRQLLYLVNKLLGQLDGIINHWEEQVQQGKADCWLIPKEDIVKKYLIAQIHEQQQLHYNQPKQSIPNRIVSLFKPFLRPIVRGKESSGGKRVEFGAKVNTWQVGGLNFIEHFSFDAFHEGNRLKQGIAFHQKHFGKLTQLGADAIYATNENRRYCKSLEITTCFKPKGRRTAQADIRHQEDEARATIGALRATVLEGSYGNDKNHYGLKKVKARTEKTEIAWIFFGMMTANAMKVAKQRMAKNKKAPPDQLSEAA